MAALVFSDPEARKRLEAITHPLIQAVSRAEEEAAQATGALVINDMPLIAEMGTAALFDAVIVVDVPIEEAVRRMVADRGWAEADARARIAAQASREERRAIATYVIDNSGSYDQLARQVQAIYDELIAD